MRTVDQALRARAQAEAMQLNPQAEARFEQAMAHARAHAAQPVRRRGWLGACLAACTALAAALLWMIVPAQDVVSNAALPTEAPAIVPLMQPSAPAAPQVQFALEDGMLQGGMKNETDEIWLVAWQGQSGSCEQQELIWLEPGAACDVRMPAQAGWAQAAWHGYRVTADVLHWLDGDVLPPQAEGYANQQLLLADAVHNGALALAPGDWENGRAGPMQLALPADWPQQDALAYYLQSGDVADGGALCSGQEMFGTAISPTTGRMLTSPPVQPVAVSISVNEKLPPFGLQHADVLYETLLSTSDQGHTRYIALFHDALAQGQSVQTGQVRSVRTAHMSISDEWGAALVYSHSTGGSTHAAPGLRQLAQPNIGLAERQQYRIRLQRSPGRSIKAPDVWGVDVSAIRAEAPFERQGWRFGAAQAQGQEAQEAIVRFGTAREVRFQWRDGAYQSDMISYLYTQGTEQTTLAFANVIVQQVAYRRLDGSDWLPDAQLVGEGPATVYSGGRAVQGRWIRQDAQQPTRFVDAQGQEISLSPGPSYVAQVPRV